MRRIEMRITKNQLVDIAIQSIRERNNLSMFWEYVNEAKRCGLLKMTEQKLKFILEEYQDIIYGKGFILQEQDSKLSDNVSTYEIGSKGSGMVKEDHFSNLKSRIIDITPLKNEIPDYLDIIQPKPVRVYLLDRLLFWPLFKVVAEFTERMDIPGEFERQKRQLYLIGRDRNTNQPFALGIPNGFVDQSFEVCLRWTLSAHKGDVVTEV